MDTTAPLLNTTTVDGNTLVLTYTDASNLLDTGTILYTDFTVTTGIIQDDVTSVVVDAANHTVTLTLTSAVVQGDIVMINYTVPVLSTFGDTAIQDAAGNIALDLSLQAVINNTPLIL